jgi:hypothetical protein
MSDLEEYELERTGTPDEPPPPLPPEPEKKGSGLFFPAMLALVAIVAIGLLAALYLLFRTPTEPEMGVTPPPLAATPRTLSSPAPTASPLVLPALDESDGLVRELTTAISSNAELARWLAQSHLVRTATAVTVNVATGESPKPHLRFLEPRTRFTAKREGGKLVPDPAGFHGYDVMADAIASLDPEATAEAYRSLEPLFDIAFQDFGMPDLRFRTILHRAMDNLLAVPVPGAEVELVPHANTYRYRNPRYQQLSPAQKQFLRTGPRNVRVVQAWLRDVKAALGAPPERGPSGSARQ